MSDMNDLFISYQWGSQESVKNLYEFLKSKKYKTWMDINRLDAGGLGLNNQLSQAIKSSRVVICCITKAYDKSENCKLEINWAKQNKKPLIILMFEDVPVEQLDNVGFIITPLLRINLFEDKQVFRKWTGPKCSWPELPVVDKFDQAF
jgi:hypothetical protein